MTHALLGLVENEIVRIGLGLILLLFGFVLALPSLAKWAFDPYVRTTRFQDRKRRLLANLPWSSASEENRSRINAAIQLRRSTFMPEPLRGPIVWISGSILLICGVAVIGGFVDAASTFALLDAVLAIAVVTLTIRARPSEGERRVATLERRTLPPGLRPREFLLALVQVPIVGIAAINGSRVAGTVVAVATLIILAGAYVYARMSSRVLFGSDIDAERFADEWARARAVSSLLALTVPAVFAYVALAVVQPAGLLAWIAELYVLGALFNGSTSMRTYYRERAQGLTAPIAL